MTSNTVASSNEAKACFSNRVKHENIIIRTLRRFGRLDSFQISKNCELSYHQVARRMSELRDSGKIYEHSKHKLDGYKSSRTVWSLIQ